MRADAQYSLLQNKFQEWFENPVSGDIPFHETADPSIENSIPVDLPEANHINQGIQKRRHRIRKNNLADSAKLIKIIFFGFIGAISFGLSVGTFFLNLNLNFEGWYSYTWPSQSFFIIISAILGFNFGLFFEYVFLQRER
ncbi:MAG: hypothetical protein PVJ21_11630 [Anaerolineales bacterium]|jgi:hypothetical protein